MELDIVAISVLVGSLLPLIISLVKGANMTRGTKQVISLLVAGVAAFVTVWADAGWTFDSTFTANALGSFGAIFALAQTTYTGFWEDRTVEVRLSNLGSNI